MTNEHPHDSGTESERSDKSAPDRGTGSEQPEQSGPDSGTESERTGQAAPADPAPREWDATPAAGSDSRAADGGEVNAADAEVTPETDAETGREGRAQRVGRYLNYALLLGLGLLALVAALRFYFAASNAISTWVSREYVSLFQAAFNLLVLLVAAVGISRQVRRLA